jgi:hypothetical protein
MVTEGYFDEKIREIRDMKIIPISHEAVKVAYPRFKDFHEMDLNNAVEEILHDKERFDFVKLLKHCSIFRAQRNEEEESRDINQFNNQAKEFYSGTLYTGECTRHQCRGCYHVTNCKVRGKEWIKGIVTIMNKNLGKKGVQELIHYMNHEYLGGIK